MNKNVVNNGTEKKKDAYTTPSLVCHGNIGELTGALNHSGGKTYDSSFGYPRTH